MKKNVPQKKKQARKTNKQKNEQTKKNAFKKREMNGRTPYLKFCDMQIFSNLFFPSFVWY